METLESLPWDYSGVDLLVYSKDTSRIKKIIKESDLESTLRDSEVGIVFCETPEDEENHHTIGLEDTKTDEVMFLEAGDVIEDFQGDLLTTAGLQEPFGVPGLGNIAVPETSICHSARTLPESYRGMVFKAQWLRGIGITKVDSSLSAKVCDHFIGRLSKIEYWGGWGDFDISESLSISRHEPKDDEKVIKDLIETWNSRKVSQNPYLRDLVWGRITTSAASLTPHSNFNVYLYPASKLTVLS